MSDDGKGATKTGYKFEYASTGRAMCKGQLLYFVESMDLRERCNMALCLLQS